MESFEENQFATSDITQNVFEKLINAHKLYGVNLIPYYMNKS